MTRALARRLAIAAVTLCTVGIVSSSLGAERDLFVATLASFLYCMRGLRRLYGATALEQQVWIFASFAHAVPGAAYAGLHRHWSALMVAVLAGLYDVEAYFHIRREERAAAEEEPP